MIFWIITASEIVGIVTEGFGGGFFAVSTGFFVLSGGASTSKRLETHPSLRETGSLTFVQSPLTAIISTSCPVLRRSKIALFFAGLARNATLLPFT